MHNKVRLIVAELVVLELVVLELALKIMFLLDFLEPQAFDLLNQVLIKSFYCQPSAAAL